MGLSCRLQCGLDWANLGSLTLSMQNAHTSIVFSSFCSCGIRTLGGLGGCLLCCWSLKAFGEPAGFGIVCRIMTNDHVEWENTDVYWLREDKRRLSIITMFFCRSFFKAANGSNLLCDVRQESTLATPTTPAKPATPSTSATKYGYSTDHDSR